MTDLVTADLADEVRFAALLVKTAGGALAGYAADYLTKARELDALGLDKAVVAELLKVGPKGYEHGWIFVGVPGVGSDVFHPRHGRGKVTRSGKRTVGVRFESGHEAAFEHGLRGEHPRAGEAGNEHFAERVDRRRGPRKPKTETPPVAEPSTALAKPSTPTTEQPKPSDPYEHVAAAHAAIREGNHEQAVNHLMAAEHAAPDQASRDRIAQMRRDLAGRIMGKPSEASTPRAPKEPDSADTFDGVSRSRWVRRAHEAGLKPSKNTPTHEVAGQVGEYQTREAWRKALAINPYRGGLTQDATTEQRAARVEQAVREFRAGHDAKVAAAGLGKPAETPKAPKPRSKAKPVDAAGVVASLGQARSRDEARQALTGLTGEQLRQVAAHGGTTLTGRRKDQMVNDLVEHHAGRRLDSEAVSRGLGSLPGAPLPQQGAADTRHAAVERSIRDAYGRVAARTGNDWVGFADLKDEIGGAHPNEHVDEAVRRMEREARGSGAGAEGPDVRVIPVANTKSLRPRDRVAAVRIGGEDNHAIRIRSGDAAAQRAEVPRRTAEEGVREAVADLARTPGGWLPLNEVRDHPALAGHSRAEIDQALIRMNHQDPRVHVVPESNQKALTEEQRAGAVMIGNQHRHIISIQGVGGGEGRSTSDAAARRAEAATARLEAGKPTVKAEAAFAGLLVKTAGGALAGYAADRLDAANTAGVDLAKFDPSEARDVTGRWSAGGSGATTTTVTNRPEDRARARQQHQDAADARTADSNSRTAAAARLAGTNLPTPAKGAGAAEVKAARARYRIPSGKKLARLPRDQQQAAANILAATRDLARLRAAQARAQTQLAAVRHELAAPNLGPKTEQFLQHRRDAVQAKLADLGQQASAAQRQLTAGRKAWHGRK